MHDRKTGVTLVDTGERDEYGMEPADNLFSSPEKTEKPDGAANGHRSSPSEDEQDMDIDEGNLRRARTYLLLPLTCPPQSRPWDRPPWLG